MVTKKAQKVSLILLSLILTGALHWIFNNYPINFSSQISIMRDFTIMSQSKCRCLVLRDGIHFCA